MFEEMESFTTSHVPDKCAGCAIQSEKSDELNRILALKRLGNSIGEKLVGEDGALFDAIVDNAFPEEIAGEAKITIRQGVGEELTLLDEKIEAAEAEIKANALACSGVLKMRAQKGDVSYTVNVCTSARVYNRDPVDPQIVPVFIRADSITDR